MQEVAAREEERPRRARQEVSERKARPRFFTFYVGPTKLLYTAPFGDKVSLLSFLESNV